MDVTAVPIASSEKAELWVLLQDYIHELSAYDEFEAVNGVYPYGYFDAYWQKGEERWPYWAVSNGERVGFALTRREPTGEMEIAEFYIRPRARRSGIGLSFAQLLLRKHPGPWLISEYRANTGAVLFWRRVIADYRYTEEGYRGDGGKPRLLQRVTIA